MSYGRYYWRGLVQVEDISQEPAVVIYSDRNYLLGYDYAIKRGCQKEVRDAASAAEIIKHAILSCFDHTETITAVSDGEGGWARLETDT